MTLRCDRVLAYTALAVRSEGFARQRALERISVAAMGGLGRIHRGIGLQLGLPSSGRPAIRWRRSRAVLALPDTWTAWTAWTPGDGLSVTANLTFSGK
jgi:hypothetical protein